MRKKTRLNHDGKDQADAEGSLASAKGFALSEQQQSIIFIVIASVLLVTLAALRIGNLDSVRFRTPDEGAYTYQSRAIAERGIEGLRSIAKEYNENEALWHFPHPLRVSYMYFLAGVMKTTGIMDARAGAYSSCVFAILTALVLVLTGLKLFNKPITLLALLFMTASPMSLAISIRSWQESMLSFLSALMIFVSCMIIRDSRKPIWYALLVGLGSYLLLVKMSAIVIYGLCMLWVLLVLFIKEKAWVKGAKLALAGLIGALLALAVLVHMIGSVQEVLEIASHMKTSMKTNIYPIEYCNGAWYRFFDMLWILSPVSAVLFLVGLVAPFVKRSSGGDSVLDEQNEPMARGMIFVMAAFMVVLFVGKKYALNLRYVSGFYVVFYLTAGMGAWFLTLIIKRFLRSISLTILAVCMGVALSLSAVNDYRNFKTVIVNSGIKDLSIRLLVESNQGHYRQ